MITEPYLLISIGLGTLFLTIYLILGIKQTKKLELADCIILFLSAAGIMAGTKVCILALNSSLFSSMKDARLYVFIGGIAVIWASIQTLLKPFQINRKNRDSIN